MRRILSAKADKSSAFYKGRAKTSEIADISGMKDDWRIRLADAINSSGKSMRKVSLEAGLAAGYVHSIIKTGKDPTINNLLSVCEVADVSLSKILFGVEMTAQVEEMVRLLALAGREEQDALLTLLKRHAAETPPQLPPPRADQEPQ